MRKLILRIRLHFAMQRYHDALASLDCPYGDTLKTIKAADKVATLQSRLSAP